MVKKLLAAGTVITTSLLIAHCSNDAQPLSVASNGENKVTAAISDLTIRDMGWAGGQLWAVTTQATGSNYYLARFSSSTNKWTTLKSYSGQKCCVSNSGKCYYVNAAGQIWWVTRNANGTYTNQRITSLPANRLARDIGAGTFDGIDRIWVRFRDNSGNNTISYADYAGSGSSVVGGISGWRGPIELFGGSPKCVSADPYAGMVGISIAANNCVNWCNPEPHASPVPGLSSNLVDVATCDGKFLVVTDDQVLYKGNGLNSWEYVNQFARSNVAMTKINGEIYVMFINSISCLEYVKFDDLNF